MVPKVDRHSLSHRDRLMRGNHNDAASGPPLGNRRFDNRHPACVKTIQRFVQ